MPPSLSLGHLCSPHGCCSLLFTILFYVVIISRQHKRQRARCSWEQSPWPQGLLPGGILRRPWHLQQVPWRQRKTARERVRAGAQLGVICSQSGGHQAWCRLVCATRGGQQKLWVRPHSKPCVRHMGTPPGPAHGCSSGDSPWATPQRSPVLDASWPWLGFLKQEAHSGTGDMDIQELFRPKEKGLKLCPPLLSPFAPP